MDSAVARHEQRLQMYSGLTLRIIKLIEELASEHHEEYVQDDSTWLDCDARGHVLCADARAVLDEAFPGPVVVNIGELERALTDYGEAVVALTTRRR